MNVCSVTFLAALTVLAGVIFHLPRGLPRQLLLGACNLAFLATWIPNRASWIALAVFLLSGYAFAIVGKATNTERLRRVVVGGYLLALVAAFIILKKYEFLSLILPGALLAHPIGIVGLSYMLFRQIHFVVDSIEGQIERPSLWVYLNYQTSLFTLLAGPIDRYQHFAAQWKTLDPILTNQHARLKAFARLLLGMIQVAYISSILDLFVTSTEPMWLSRRHPADVLRFVGWFYAYPAYVYFNFRGYCDIAIGAASLVGLGVPENFNQPYLARNMIDYWQRWHMTLTHWIRDYVFTPVYKRIVMWRPSLSRPAAYFSYFLALFLAGVWHGTSSNFVLFGLVHGTGVSVSKWWEERIVHTRGRAGLREYMKDRRIRAISIFITINFACFAFLFFRPEPRHRFHFIRSFLMGG